MIELQLRSQKAIALVVVMILDILFLGILYCGLLYRFSSLNVQYSWIFWYAAYLISVVMISPIAYKRIVRTDLVMARVLKTSILMSLLYFMLNNLIEGLGVKGGVIEVIVLCMIMVTLAVSRFLGVKIITTLRSRNYDNCEVVYVGAGVNLRYLLKEMNVKGTGYHVHGYFQENVSQNIGKQLPRLGDVADVVDYLKNHHVDMLVCNLPQERANEIVEIMKYCDNNMIRFFTVPNINNYMRSRLELRFVGDMPILSRRNEPLTEPFNRFIKCTFDKIIALLALPFVALVFLIVAPIIKIQSPGPIFFNQKRNGRNGKEFYCHKFRSMHVNKDADKVQATENDPRKFKFGDWMRRNNIDELPQVWNVLVGEMSIVGPRPHMKLHNEEYSKLIQGYNLRNIGKPGITGWAQVTGFRGETKELWQMEERVARDVWYLENWSFFLDIKIIWLTFWNMIKKKDKAAY